MTKQHDDLERLLTVREAAHLENTCARTIRRRPAPGGLPAPRYGRGPRGGAEWGGARRGRTALAGGDGPRPVGQRQEFAVAP